MARPRQLTRALALLLGASTLTTAIASDDEGRPLYVIHDGKRIPTVIVPPKPTAEAGLRPAVWQLAEPYPTQPTPEPSSAYDPDDRPGPQDEPQWYPLAPEPYDLGYYAGYPVSRYRRAPARRFSRRPYAYPGYGRYLEETYRARRYIAERERGRRFNQRDMRRRKARVLSNHEKALRLGLERLKGSDYARAVVSLTMAANLNHGDPACRIHLAQARMAQGHYQEAGEVLRRALQLQPKLVYVSLNLPSYYADPTEFDLHVDQLATWVTEHRADAQTYFLLGFMHFQRDDFDQAYAAFRVAARRLRNDPLTQTYLTITKPPAR